MNRQLAGHCVGIDRVAVSYHTESTKKTTLEMRYFISSKVLERDEFAQAVR